MKLFGTIFPFIGFKTYPLFDDGYPDLEKTIQNPNYESDCFVMEWFGLGIVLFTTEIRKIK